MAAAPRLFDDAPIASPELALVDADLAAQLRADLATGEAFRPRHVPRDEHATLVFDAVVRELPDDEPHVIQEDEPRDQVVSNREADVVDDAPAEPAGERPIAPPALRALPAPEEPSSELSEYLVGGDEDVEASPDDAVHPEEASEVPALPWYVVSTNDDVVGREVVEEAVSEQASDGSLAPPVSVAVPAPQVSSELPDYVVVPDEDVDAIPDDGVLPEEEPAPALPECVVPLVEHVTVEHVAPEYVVHEEQIASDVVVEVSSEQASSSSDYPVLPDLEERSEALEETEAALRRIREQMVVGTSPSGRRRPRLRRRFTVFAGLCAVVTVAAFAVDVTQTPGFLAF